MDMTLDDIIRTKSIGKRTVHKIKRKTQGGSVSRSSRNINKPMLMDARFKIIQQNRSKIRDARDKLAEITRANGDVRKRLLQKKLVSEVRNTRPQYPSKKDYSYLGKTLMSIHTRSHTRAPRGYIDYDNMNDMEDDIMHLPASISRTVRNDVSHRASDPSHRYKSDGMTDHYDPFDVYEVQAPPDLKRHISPDLDDNVRQVTSRNITRKSQSREPSNLVYPRHFSDSLSHLSYEMRTRLEHAPDPHASVGIFANSSKQESGISSHGYRIVVSNLHTNVTDLDIKELFEDIGELYDSRIVRPGVAEVIYKKLSDAENAVDTYHNRQLDGQPMKCLLVNPRSSNRPTAPAINSSSLASKANYGKTPLEIDIDALHKVLFRRN